MNPLLLIFFSLCSVVLPAQAGFWECSGRVLSEQGEPLAWAAVYVSNLPKGGRILAYAHTGEDGRYALSCEIDTSLKKLYLSVDLLGYAKQQKEISLAGGQRVFEVNVVLKPAPFQMNEVVVRDSLPEIVERSDTTEYVVADFSDSTEVYVEELLKKIPGVEIDEHGSITVNGKPVKKLLVEGDDFFGQNYTVISRNMRANAIERVQLIEGYRENPVFAEVTPSDDLVLNLVLKEDVKGKPSGNISTGFGRGDDWKWAVGANVFSFGKKQRAVLMLNGDNVSSSFRGGVSNFMDMQMGREHLPLPAEMDQSLLSFSSPYSVGLSPRFSNRRQSGLVGYAQIFTLSPTWKLKVFGLGDLSEDRQQFVQETSFFGDSTEFSVAQQTAFNLWGKTYEGALEGHYLSPDHRSSLLLALNLNGQTERQNSLMERSVDEGAAVSWPVSLAAKPLTYSVSGEYSRKANRYMVVQAAFRALAASSSERLQSMSEVYPAFFGSDSAYASLEQSVNSSQRLYAGFLRSIYARGAYHLEVQAGGISHRSSLDTDIRLFSEAPDAGIRPDSSYRNAQILEEDRWSLKASGALRLGYVLLQGSLGADYRQLRLDRVAPLDTALWLPGGLFSLRYKRTDRFKFSIHYAWRNQLPLGKELLEASYFSNYLSLDRARAHFDVLPLHAWWLSLRHKDASGNRQVYLRLQALLNPALRGQNTTLSPYVMENNLYYPASFGTLGGRLGFNQFVSDWGMLFKLRADYGITDSEGRLEGQLRHLSRKDYGLHVFWGFALKAPFSIQWENDLMLARARIRTDYSSFEQNSFKLQSRVTLNYYPSDAFSLRARLYHSSYYFAGKQTASFYAADFRVLFDFTLRERPANLALEAVNLTGASSFDSFHFTDFSESVFSVQAVPMFFLLRFDLGL